MSNETIAITTPDGIEHFQFARCLAALRIEVRTGMTLRQGSMLAHVQRAYGITAKRKPAALAQMEDLYEARYGRRYGA
jgi:hypothetical protein